MEMTSGICQNCNRSRARMWCGYSSACNDCAARAVARSIVAFEAVMNRSTIDLRDTLSRVLPGIEYETARGMVWAWWRIDHDQKTKAT